MTMDAGYFDPAVAQDLLRAELDRLRAANADLAARLQEAEDTLDAIRSGDVDALIVGEDIYTLDSANAASNAMRKDVLAQMQDAVLAFDVDDHLIFMNPAAEAQYGRSASDMLGRPREELYRERWADGESALRALRELRETGSYRAESVHCRADGREIQVEATVARLDDAGGRPLGSLCVIRNIDERVQAQARLAEAAVELARRERQFATLVENSPDIFARMGRDLRHLYVSPVIERYTGVPAAAHIGRTNAELGLPPALCEAWTQAFERVFRSGAVERIKFRFVATDGRTVDFESRLIPEFADDGTVESVLSIASDITEQERADAELRESKARLEFTLVAARIGEWEIDVDSGAGRQSMLFHRCFGRAAPQESWDLAAMLSHVHPDDRERVRAAFAHSFATRSGLAVECRVTWPDDSVHWIEMQGGPYVDRAGGGRVRYLGIVSDVTARKHAEAALRDADARKDEFLATLAHELRNPLAPIRNAVQIMHLSRDEAMHRNARTIIERQLRQMVHLVDDLLDVSRISQGKVELRRETVDLSTIVATAIETSRPLIDAGHHELTVTLAPPRSLMVDGDVTRLCQILANLLNNAAKYTPDGGRIAVLMERDGAHASITVRDSGIGIARDMLPRVFDMFSQVDRSMERSQGGLGIGLALVKRLVEMHGGSVRAASDGLDRGCTFVVRLPLIAPAAAATPAAPHALEAGPANDLRVLVVDDNVDSAESLAQVLRLLGYQARTGHDGLEAVEIARAWRPAVVLLDLGMPGMNGFDTARALRALPEWQPGTLIALSGWGQHEDRRRSREAGFDHHFVKPVDVDALVETLRIAGGSPR
jgi:PAS domain S-box-containing protein